MSVARIVSRAQLGLYAPLVQVEVHLGAGLPTFSIVGLPATAVKESKERVRAALINSSFEFPAGRITVNLAPADLPKEGGRFDLPIALGILCASGQLQARGLEHLELYGELGLGGELKPVRGLLPAAAHALAAGHDILVPAANREETAVAAGDRALGSAHLLEVCAHLSGTRPLAPPPRARLEASALPAGDLPDLRDVRGQRMAKRALVIAAAGAHSLLLVGPPGAGKSMLAQRLPPLLPPLDEAEALEVATIASVGGLGFEPRRWGARPFRSPHHTASAHAIVGGGPQARPGEISLAHHGVLFLDELPEFDRRVLEALREPLESGVISVARASVQAEYPARFQLVAAMNPCPCGHEGDPTVHCRCSPRAILRYRGRISGPLLDRIDLRIEVPPVAQAELLCPGADEQDPAAQSSAAVAVHVRRARERQRERAGCLNAHLTVRDLERDAPLDRRCQRLLAQGMVMLGLSARSLHRVRRVARTIADLEGLDAIEPRHVAEALQLRRALEPAPTAAEASG